MKSEDIREEKVWRLKSCQGLKNVKAGGNSVEDGELLEGRL